MFKKIINKKSWNNVRIQDFIKYLTDMLTDILWLKGLKMTIIILKKNNKMFDFEIKKAWKPL